MAGHSKWSNIQHRKHAQDAKKSRLFTRLIREITVAARENPDFKTNARLRLARRKALSEDIKLDTVNKAIQQSTQIEIHQVEEIHYGGYGPGGHAILVQAFSNNRNRTAGEIRHTFNKYGGNLGIAHSVLRLFKQKGLIPLANSALQEHDLVELAVQCDAEDIVFSAQSGFRPKLITSIESYESTIEWLEKNNVAICEAEIAWVPQDRLLIDNDDILHKIRTLIDALENLLDVQNVYATCSWQLS